MHAVTLLGLCSLCALQEQGSKSYDDERRLEPADKRTRRIGTARDSRSSQQQLRERRLCNLAERQGQSMLQMAVLERCQRMPTASTADQRLALSSTNAGTNVGKLGAAGEGIGAYI